MYVEGLAELLANPEEVSGTFWYPMGIKQTSKIANLLSTQMLVHPRHLTAVCEALG